MIALSKVWRSPGDFGANWDTFAPLDKVHGCWRSVFGNKPAELTVRLLFSFN